MLTDRGLVDDKNIKNDQIQKAIKAKKRKMFHNTQLMLKHYRDMTFCAQIGCSKELIKAQPRKITRETTCLTERRKLIREHSMAGKR